MIVAGLKCSWTFDEASKQSEISGGSDGNTRRVAELCRRPTVLENLTRQDRDRPSGNRHKSCAPDTCVTRSAEADGAPTSPGPTVGEARPKRRVLTPLACLFCADDFCDAEKHGSDWDAVKRGKRCCLFA